MKIASGPRFTLLFAVIVGMAGLPVRGGVFSNVPAADEYVLVHELEIPTAPNFSSGITYDLDLRNHAGAYDRIAYYLELRTGTGPTNYIWVAADAFTSDISKVGVPTFASGAIFQQNLTSMDVLSNVSGITNGTGLTTGNIEFWPQNYSAANGAGVPNASGSAYDFGDTRSGSGDHGCMQIHNHDLDGAGPGASGQTLFAFNVWNRGATACLGIGNRPAADLDWTFANNAGSYSEKRLLVFVRQTAATAPVIVGVEELPDLSGVVVTFSKPLEDAAANTANFAIDGGVSVVGASLDSMTKLSIALTTTALDPLAGYTLTVNGVRDRTSAHTAIAAGSTARFPANAYQLVSEANDYRLVYEVDVPNGVNYSAGITYDRDLSAAAGAFDRIAYFLKLGSGRAVDYAWTSMDAFTNDVDKIGVPTAPSGAVYQQLVANLNVRASVAGVVNADGIATGNIEFWPSNFNAQNTLPVPGASGSAYDFGDNPTPGAYGCMQVHNYGAAQTVWSFVGWGGANKGALGIGNDPLTARTNYQPDWTFSANAYMYDTKHLQVYVRESSPSPPVLTNAAGVVGATNVVLTFDKALADDATNVAHYAIDGGVTVLAAALDPTYMRTVTLTTSQQMGLSNYVVTVNGVTDRTSGHTPIAPDSTAGFTSGVAHGALYNVPDAGNYAMVYSLEIPDRPNFTQGIVYDVDRRGAAPEFDRVAYYLELETSDGEINFAWTAFNAVTNNLDKIGVPTLPSGALYQQPVANLDVRSSVAGIVNGTGLTGGNIEFWPYNYSGANAVGVPNASETERDFGDQYNTGGTYGSMQVHNHDAQQTIFAFNHWNAGSAACLGIGNDPNSPPRGNYDPDWTFADNSDSYTVKRLQVFVRQTGGGAPVITRVTEQGDSTTLVVTFSKPVSDDATNVAHYAINGGVNVLSAVLDDETKSAVTLTTTATAIDTSYTLTVNGVTDRTDAHTPIAANTTVTFPYGAYNNVRVAGDYTLVYSLDVPDTPNYNSTEPPYDPDLHTYVSAFDSVAYYLETQTAAGSLDYVWVALDALTGDITRIGVPTFGSGAHFQQVVTNMTVRSNVGGIVNGTDMDTGNIEFWPDNYGAPNTIGIPNASGTTYDFGDQYKPGEGNHGSMQLHNHAWDAKQVLFAFNHWNSGVQAGLGIGSRPSGNPDWTFGENTLSLTVKRIQVFVRETTPSAPLITSATGSDDSTHVVLTFSKPLADDAANVAHYAIDGGLSVLAAELDPLNKVTVTLTTSLQPGYRLYTVTVNGLTDRTAGATPIAPDSTVQFHSVAWNGVFNNVPDVKDYTPVYVLTIPNACDFDATGVPYGFDQHIYTPAYNRVAYYMELQKSGESPQFAWVAIDPLSANAKEIGVPTAASGGFFQQLVNNMDVICSVDGVVNGTGITTGNIEFWPGNYNQSNPLGIPNASASTFDFGDGNAGTTDGHGSMQLHNHGADLGSSTGQVIFAFNHWNANGAAGLGIGNQSPTGDKDWTFANNGGSYTLKKLQVFVRPTDGSAAPTMVRVSSQAGSDTITVTFSKPLEDTAALAANYALSGGLTVLSADLDEDTKSVVTLTLSSPPEPNTPYTLTVNGLTDRTDAHTPIAPDSTFAFPYDALNVADAAGYTLIYSLPVPDKAGFRNNVAIPYDVNFSGRINRGFDRVAYYLELVGDDAKWVYASMDDFTGGSANGAGIPHSRYNPVAHQAIVNDMNIFASANSGIVTGSGLATGNVEMWPGNYGAANAISIPNASGSVLDFGDQNTSGVGAGHGSFQLHNHGADLGASTGQVLFAYNDWGGNSPGTFSELGIGNNPSGNMDWTFQDTANLYGIKTFQILVHERTDDPMEAVKTRVAEARHLELVYDLSIPDQAHYDFQLIPYAIDRSALIPPSLGRIAYYLRLDSQWVYVSMDAFTQSPAQVGVPSRGPNGNGAVVLRQYVTNMNVYASSAAPVQTGIGLQYGNIEMWNMNYQSANTLPVTNASGGQFDFGDNPSSGNYGSMQVHNSDLDGPGPGVEGQTIFAYNRWGNAGENNSNSDLGIGNRGTGEPDWTFAQNAAGYAYKHLQVLVLPRLYVNVPEADRYQIIYAMDIPNDRVVSFNTQAVPYGIDRSVELAGTQFNRVAYYLELDDGTGLKWVWVSFDAITRDLREIGIPTYPIGRIWQQPLANMNVVASSGSGIATGTGLSGGNIEFWPNGYSQSNEAGVPGASDGTYDFGDNVNEGAPNGYGSMQIHNHTAGQTIFAYNAWGSANRISGLGIGNQPTGSPDWTHADNAGSYTVKNLFVLIEMPEGGTVFKIR